MKIIAAPELALDDQEKILRACVDNLESELARLLVLSREYMAKDATERLFLDLVRLHKDSRSLSYEGENWYKETKSKLESRLATDLWNLKRFQQLREAKGPSDKPVYEPKFKASVKRTVR